MTSAPLSHPRLSALLIALSLCGLFTACGGERAQSATTPSNAPAPTFIFEIEARAIDATSSEGIAAIPVHIDGKTVGYTGEDGSFRALITAEHETPITLSLGESAQYSHVPDEVYEIEEILKVEYAEGRTALRANMVSLHAKLSSHEKDYLVWLKTRCEGEAQTSHCQGLGVVVNGERVATTDATGRAHFVHTGSPGEVLDVHIDTSLTPSDKGEVRELDPPNPSYELALADTSQAYAIDQPFGLVPLAQEEEEEEVVEEQPQKVRRRSSRRRRSRRAVKRRSKPEPESEPSQGGSIDLLGTAKKKAPAKKAPPTQQKDEPIKLF